MGINSAELGPEKDFAVEDSSSCKLQTRPLVREAALEIISRKLKKKK
jgi:hypothetical protein